jgi:putative spermidine/putrescine transport system substrate-binding protein
MGSRVVVASLLLLAVLALPLVVAPARAQNALVVSVWGGNWKDTVERVVGKAFTAKTGIPVEYEVGGTIDRLAKARVAKGNPLVDLNFTTTHVARLYISDGLYDRLDLARLPASKEIAREAFRSDYHIGSWAYVYTVVYRPDLIKDEITKWSDLWKPSLKGKIAMPDFDPSHIITIAALMEGGNEINWQKGEPKLRQLKESIAAFFSTDAQSQDLMKTGQGPVQVMLSVNAYHLQEQGIAVKVVQPADYPGIVGIDTMAVMAGSKKADAAHQFINLALSKDIQTELVKALRAGPVNLGATVPATLKGQPGIFSTTAEWKERGYIMNDEVRAKNLPGWREWFTANIVKK